jgi:hypothetical protein
MTNRPDGRQFVLSRDVLEQVRAVWLVLDHAVINGERLWADFEAHDDSWVGSDAANESLLMLQNIASVVEAIERLRQGPGGDLHEG